MDPRAVLAARNNAEWCDLVCRTHGVDTEFSQDAWIARRRSPPLYPDAVTLRPHLPASDLLRRIDSSRGCSIKDSFATVDLSTDGFGLLFTAEWIFRRPTGGQTSRTKSLLTWSAVRTSEQLQVWAAAHGGGAIFRPALLDNPAVAILMALDRDDVVAGVIGSQSASVVGLSNLFARATYPNDVWAEVSDAVSALFPGLPLVGYEHGASLEATHRTGFESLGPLRVRLND